MSTFRHVILIEKTDEVQIPIHKSIENIYLIWREEECAEDVLKRHGKPWAYSSFKVWPVGVDSGEYSRSEITVYEVECNRSGFKYYLIVDRELSEYDDIFHSVAVPFNKLNLIDFYRKYMMPLSGKPYVQAD